MGKEYKHKCFKCGIDFVIYHEIDTDKPLCTPCFKKLLKIDNYSDYNNFITNKDY